MIVSTPSTGRRSGRFLLPLGAAGVLLATVAFLALRDAPPAHVPALDATVPAPPTPVTVDATQRLVYELHLANRDSVPLYVLEIRIHAGEHSGTRHGALAVLADSALAAAMAPLHDIPAKDENSTTIRPGARAIAYVEIDVDTTIAALPDVLRHRVLFFRTRQDSIHVDAPVHAAGPSVLGPPLRGGPWAAVHHPSWPRGHRRVTYTVDGVTRIPGRFAVDWILLDKNGSAWRGDQDVVADWLGHGAEVLAVADATVAAARDDVAESPRISTHPDHPLEDATGNYVALDLGNGRFVFYEHLLPGSIRVAPGERVRRGQPLAALGFTGHTTGPHLHLHVADASSPLGAEGLPFVLECFDVLGRYDDLGTLGIEPWDARPSGTPERRLRELPPPNAVVRLGC